MVKYNTSVHKKNKKIKPENGSTVKYAMIWHW